MSPSALEVPSNPSRQGVRQEAKDSISVATNKRNKAKLSLITSKIQVKFCCFVSPMFAEGLDVLNVIYVL